MTDAQWEARKYCSPSCAGKAASARRHKEKEELHFLPLDPVAAQTVNPKLHETDKGADVTAGGRTGFGRAIQVGVASKEMALAPGDAAQGKSGAEGLLAVAADDSATGADRAAAQKAEQKQGVMRELRIVRVGPNPRMVVCEYFELAQRRTCTVLVKRTQKWVRGMRFTMAEPKDEAAYLRPWVYEGKAPRWRGRW